MCFVSGYYLQFENYKLNSIFEYFKNTFFFSVYIVNENIVV